MAARTLVVGLLLLAGCQTIGSSQSALDQSSRERLQSRLSNLSAQSSATTDSNASSATDAPLQEAADLLSVGRDEDALAVLARILRDDPRNVAAIRLTAGTARRLGDWRLQNAALQQLIELETASPVVLNQCGKAILQSLPQGEADDAATEAALAALRRSMNLAPDNPRFAQDLFVALAEQKQNVEAEAVLSLAIQNCPQDSLLPMAAARFFEARGRWPDAIRQYDAALQISPRNRLWRRQRGICHAQLQNWEKACDDLQHALRGTTVKPQLTEYLTWADAAFHADRCDEVVEILDLLRHDAGYRTPDTELLRIRSLTRLRQFDAATDATLQAMIDWPQHAGLRRLAAELERSAAEGDRLASTR